MEGKLNEEKQSHVNLNETKLKKITPVDMPFLQVNEQFKQLALYADLMTDEVQQLRDYVLSQVDLSPYSDIELFIKTMEWVSDQWEHDGINDAGDETTSYEILHRAKRGEKFRCVEYAKVTVDILQSFGYVARKIHIYSHDSDYGGAGKSHVAVEAWSNDDNKWIFLDPQVSVYALYENDFLNYYDIYELNKQGQLDQIQFVISEHKVAEADEAHDQLIARYRSFLSMYFGYIGIDQVMNDQSFHLVLCLEAQRPFLVFQAMDRDHLVFTEKVEDLYFPLNLSHVLFEYRNKVNFAEATEGIEMNTLDDFKQHMHLYAVRPEYTLRFLHSMKWFSHYEIKINDERWIEVYTDGYEWDLDEWMNSLQIRPVNQLGVKGVGSSFKIHYGSDEAHWMI